MAREFARKFYKSKSWKQTRQAYFQVRHGLCERCLANGRYVPGEIVHHKIHLTPTNINNPVISLGFGNLELLCRECHAQEHSDALITKPRVEFDDDGNLLPLRSKDDG